MSQTSVGESWKPFLQENTLSWCKPDDLNPDSFIRHARSEWIQRILQNAGIEPSGSVRVLEAGCGTGMFGLSLALLGCQVDAFDYNEPALVVARHLEIKARQARADMQIHFYQGNLLSIGARADTYDLVFNQGVVEYFVDDAQRAQALREMVRVTRPGGWVVVIDQHTGHPFRSMWRCLGWGGYTRQPPMVTYTPNIMARELTQTGLTQIRLDGIQPWKSLPIFRIQWYERARWTKELVYLVGRTLERGVPLPRFLRRQFGIQILAAGKKR